MKNKPYVTRKQWLNYKGFYYGMWRKKSNDNSRVYTATMTRRQLKDFSRQMSSFEAGHQWFSSLDHNKICSIEKKGCSMSVILLSAY